MNTFHGFKATIRRVAASFVVYCHGLPFSHIRMTVTEQDDSFTASLDVVPCNAITGDQEGAVGFGKTVDAAAEMALDFFYLECSRIAAVKPLELSDFAFQQPHKIYEHEKDDWDGECP